jgi:hypothetical protein
MKIYEDDFTFWRTKIKRHETKARGGPRGRDVNLPVLSQEDHELLKLNICMIVCE